VDTPFDILRVDPEADEEAIRQAYRERAKETHPDQGGSAAQFRLVKAAYEEIESGHWDGEWDRPDGAVEGTPARPNARNRGGAGDDTTEGADDEDHEDGSVAEEETVVSRVEYLDFEVIDDHDWDLGDEDLFAKAAAADLGDEDYGQLLVQPGESVLEAAESRGFAWPYACRGGACANCAVMVVDGELEMPHDTILPPEMIDSGIRLSCNGVPVTDEMQVIYNVKHLPGLEELRLPPRPFEQAYAGD
jgi:ferredoxin